MARFLSGEWFAEVAAAGEPDGVDGPDSLVPDSVDSLVIEQVVDGTPDGQVTYRVLAGPDRARIVWPLPPDAPPPDVRISCGWDTAVAIARGDLSTQRALMDGRLRVKGVPSRGVSPGLDPVPPSVRARTSY